MTDISLDNYYYGEQIKRYIVVFMAIFGGLKVGIGKNDYNSQTDKILVPIAYGSRDRQVDAILSENTQNKILRVPHLSAKEIGIELASDLYSGQGEVINNSTLPLGGSFPDDLLNIKSVKAIPYRMRMELVVYASNTDQHFQMLEQILMLFNPFLQVQTSDAFGDHFKFTRVTLENVGLDEQYPSGTSRRIITSSLQFTMEIYLSPPYNLKKEYVKNIKIRISEALTGDVNQLVQEKSRENFNNEGVETYADVDELNIPKN